MNRRDFFKKTMIAAGAGVAVAGVAPFSFAMENKFPGIIYTRANPGKWVAKVESHVPLITVKGRRVTVKTKHPMSRVHFIVRHTLVTSEGEVIGEKTFFPSDSKVVSEFKLPRGRGTYYATSFCNKHDMWVEEFTV